MEKEEALEYILNFTNRERRIWKEAFRRYESAEEVDIQDLGERISEEYRREFDTEELEMVKEGLRKIAKVEDAHKYVLKDIFDIEMREVNPLLFQVGFGLLTFLREREITWERIHRSKFLTWVTGVFAAATIYSTINGLFPLFAGIPLFVLLLFLFSMFLVRGYLRV